jgi:drug/metabolite transporter (DMT)-like permease
MTLQHKTALAALVFTTLTWGITPVFVRAYSLAVGPDHALVIRLILVAIVFAAALSVSTGFKIERQDWPRLTIISLIGMLGYYAGSAFGFAYAPAGVGTLIMASQPMIITLLAAAIGADRLTPATMAGLVIAFIGSALLVWNDSLATATSSSAEVIYGCFLIFLAGLAWAVFVVFSKPLIRKYGALKITGLSNIIIAFPVLPFFTMAMFSELRSLPTDALQALLFLIFLGATTSVVSWNYAAGKLRASVLGSSLYLVPLIAVFFGWLILDEPITLRIIMAGLVILAGVAVAQYGDALVQQKRREKSRL